MGAVARIATLLVAAATLVPVTAKAGRLPADFVYLSDIAPEIRQDMRYAGSGNFTGGKVPGYSAAECVLASKTALALKAVQKALSSQGFGVKVFDCYRPERAVRHFVVWATSGRGFDPNHHPRVDRKRLIAEGYIARRSGHSNGYTIDLTLTDAKGVDLDMGTPFDFFDPLAHTASKGIDQAATQRRRILLDAMVKGGFVNYSREWWHFSLRERPPKARTYDFDIVPRGG
jgi:zinc D-Ala-D-Ala dipeptidase